jgi:hypothetical protein
MSKWGNFGQMVGNGRGFLAGFFEGKVRRRGTHVNIPKIGSRVGVFVFGGIYGFCAELRREFVWGNLNLGFFGVLGVGPWEVTEEGGPMCALGNF